MVSSVAKRFAEIGSDKPPVGPRAGLGTAIVLGGSVAGMLAARVLADHAETVVIIERDVVTAGADGRRGVPQSSQVHALLAGGSRQLERWFPGFIARAVAAGGSLVPPQRQGTYVDGVRKVLGADISLLSGTRPFLEGRIDAPARDFLALQRVIVDAAWQISASEERTGSEEPQRKPVSDRLARRIVGLIVQASATDTAVNAAFQEVTQMLRHPSTLAAPGVVWRAWRARHDPLPAPTLPLD